MLGGGVKLPPEVRVDSKAIPDAHTENYYLLLPHVIDNPSKVREFPTLNAMTEDAEEELNLRLSV